MSKLRISKRLKRRLAFVFLPVFTVLLVLTGVAFTVNANQYRTIFLRGTSINGHDASELTVDEAENLLRSDISEYTLSLHFKEDAVETLRASDIGLKYVSDGSVRELLDSQNRYAWLSGIFGSERLLSVTPQVTYDEPALINYLNKLPEMQAASVISPEDARLVLNDEHHLELIPEVIGNRLDRELLENAVRESLSTLSPDLDLEEAGAYMLPALYSDDEKLVSSLENVNRFLDTTITYTLSDGTPCVIDAARTSAWLTKNPDGTWEIQDDVIASQSKDFISELAAADDTYGYFRTFASTNFGNVHMDSDNLHGHSLDQETMTEKLISALKECRSGSASLIYKQYVDMKDPHFGGTYIEIDITNQQVFYYLNNELNYETGCVTGLEGYNSTPSGIYEIEAKYYDIILDSFQVHVNFFLKVVGGIGLHDASWRAGYEFGSGTYLYDGSHGCINLPYEGARYFYNNVEEGTPVIIFRG